MPSSLKFAAQRIAHQQCEIDELKATNAQLLEQFAKWQYNAYKRGIKEDQLNQPLPRIDRERTDKRTSTELENAR
jgi:FtsZ-binding cell division protein ZapB